MRSRKKSYTQHELIHNPYIVKQAKILLGNWQSTYFKNLNPINIEIGTGKGMFLNTISDQNNNINFIGIEKEKEIISMAARLILGEQKIKTKQNIALMLASGQDILQYFAEDEINKIYLNFSDPWPKTKNMKRRLTYTTFLNSYKHILKKGGILAIKTDNMSLYDFSLSELKKNNWGILNCTTNLHATQFHTLGSNIMTEYETKFSKKGMNIYMIEATV